MKREAIRGTGGRGEGAERNLSDGRRERRRERERGRRRKGRKLTKDNLRTKRQGQASLPSSTFHLYFR